MGGMVRFVGKLLFILALFAILFSYAMFQGGFVSWFLFFSFLPIFLYHVGLLFYPIQRWKVTRHLSRHIIRSGDRVQVTIRIKRKIPFPLYYCICEEVFPDTLKKIDNQKDKYRRMDQPDQLYASRSIKKIIFPGFRRVVELPYYMEYVPRGEHRMQMIRIKTGDVFGMVKKEHVFHMDDLLVAFPMSHSLRLTDSINSFEQGSVTSLATTLKNTNVATGVREYTPGDRFSWIDWKQTAKKQSIMTKEFEQEKSTDTLIVLDACHYKGLNVLAFEAAVEMAMSLMDMIQKQTSEVGLLSVGTDTTYFPIHHDPLKQEWIRKHLTHIQPTGQKPLPVALGEEMAVLPSGNSMILITTHADNAFRQMIQQMKQRTKRVVVVFIQAESRISEQEHALLKQLQYAGTVVNILTEKQLLQQTIEVRVS